MNRDRHEIATELRQLLRVLVRQGWVVVLCVLVAGGVGYYLASREKDVYEANAQMLVQAYSPDLTLPNTAAAFSDPTRARATALQLATIPQISERVRSQLHVIRPDATITTSAAGDSDVITVKARAPTAREAADYANAYATQYIAYRREINQQRYNTAADVIREKLDRLKSKALAKSGTPTPKNDPTAQRKGERHQALEQLRKQIDRLHVLSATQTGGAQIVQPALPPNEPVAGKELRNGLIGGFAGLILGLTLILLRERLRDRVSSEDDLAALAPGIPVLGYVPSGRGKRATGRIAEGFHNLATSVRGLKSDGGPRTILVTSADAQDGKSTTAMNLALDLEQRGANPLYVEGDMRRPALDKAAELDAPTDGLRAVLSGTRSLDESVGTAMFAPGTRSRSGAPRVALGGRLNVLPAGTGDQQPQTILGDRSASALLARARERAGYVVIDGPPLGIVGDMLPVAKRVDAVIVVVRLGHTRSRRLRRLLEQLANADVTPTGIVVLGAETGEYYS